MDGVAYLRVAGVPPGCTFRDAAVRESYLDIIGNGLKDLGADFGQRYSASTDTPPQN